MVVRCDSEIRNEYWRSRPSKAMGVPEVAVARELASMDTFGRYFQREKCATCRRIIALRPEATAYILLR